MLNLTIKIRPSPKVFAFGFFAENRYICTVMQGDTAAAQAKRAGGARPCKKAVGNTGIRHKKPSQTADIHQAYKCAGAPLSAQRSLFPRLLFCSPSGAKRGKPTVYHHFAKASTDSPNRKRKASRRKLLGGKKVGRDDLGFRKQDCHLFSPQYIVLLRFTPQ